MMRAKKLAIALLVFLPAVSIIWCGYMGYAIITSQCDIDGYLKDSKTKEELSVALRNLERQHNVTLNPDLMIASCTDIGVDVPLEYYTPSRFSKYGIMYNFSLRATYSLDSREVTLQTFDRFNTTENVLTYIDSLENVIAEFETTPQMNEFVNQFNEEGVRLVGTVDEEHIRAEAFPTLELLMEGYSLSADLTYSTTRHSISSYSLPNRITWHAFPEVPVLHEIVTEQLLVNELSNCVISTQEKAYATTEVYFFRGPSVSANVKLVCGDTGEDKWLQLILGPDGSYTSEVLR